MNNQLHLFGKAEREPDRVMDEYERLLSACATQFVHGDGMGYRIRLQDEGQVVGLRKELKRRANKMKLHFSCFVEMTDDGIDFWVKAWN